MFPFLRLHVLTPSMGRLLESNTSELVSNIVQQLDDFTFNCPLTVFVSLPVSG